MVFPPVRAQIKLPTAAQLEFDCNALPPPSDDGIHRSMPASTSGCRPASAGRGSGRHLQLDARPGSNPASRDDPILQAKRDSAIGPQFPHLSEGADEAVRPSASLVDAAQVARA